MPLDPTEIDDERQEIVDMIDELGATASFHALTSRTGDRTTSSVSETPDPNSPYTQRITPPFPASDRFADGDVVRYGDLMFYLPALDLEFTPVVGMKVEWDGGTYTAVAVEKVATGNYLGLWKFVVRGTS